MEKFIFKNQNNVSDAELHAEFGKNMEKILRRRESDEICKFQF